MGVVESACTWTGPYGTDRDRGFKLVAIASCDVTHPNR